jgi:hypothetical protein
MQFLQARTRLGKLLAEDLNKGEAEHKADLAKRGNHEQASKQAHPMKGAGVSSLSTLVVD